MPYVPYAKKLLKTNFKRTFSPEPGFELVPLCARGPGSIPVKATNSSLNINNHT